MQSSEGKNTPAPASRRPEWEFCQEFQGFDFPMLGSLTLNGIPDRTIILVEIAKIESRSDYSTNTPRQHGKLGRLSRQYA
jgi:hypothetical protein